LQSQQPLLFSSSMRKRKITVRRYNDPSRPNLKFVVRYRETGKPRRRFFESEAAAKSFAAWLNAEMKRNGVEGAQFPLALRAMALECSAVLSEFGKTLRDATHFYVTHLRASAKSCTAVELLRELLAAKTAAGKSARHLGDMRVRLTVFARAFDGQPVAAITTAAIDDWLRSLKVAPVTQNNFRRLLILFFNFAIKRGYAAENPAAETERANIVGEAPGILTVQQTANLLVAAPPELVAYIAIGAFAGLRRAELERLDWSDVHFADNLIEVTAQKAKTARRRFIKMQPNLRDWLTPVRKHSGKVAPDEFRYLFPAARRNAGIEVWPSNALRHSFASYHLAHFKDAAALALEMGHTNSGMIFEHYRQLVKPKDAAAYWDIRPPKASKKIVQLVAR
jgi:integrase